MGKFDSYFLMENEDILEYVQEKYDFFEKNAKLSVKEIGDGNLNYVFRVTNEKSGKSVILKHSGIETRAKSGRKVDVDRNRIEAEILTRQATYAPEFIPEIYGYDTTMCCMAMEDLKNFAVMRTALLQYQIFPLFAEQITTYLVNILLPSTDIAMDHKEKKQLVKSYINPDLCNITEQLVYTEAFGNFSKKNYVVPELQSFIETEIYADQALVLEVAKLKFSFMEHAQTLLHGDLHSGSIFINLEGLKVFDPEFAFYGPMGYDIGNVIAHLIFAKYHSLATQPEGMPKTKFQNWITTSILAVYDLFIKKFLKKYDEIVTDPLAKVSGFKEHYLAEILQDTAATAGCEIIRRIVGVAKVKDITAITDEKIRAQTEMNLVKIAKSFIFNKKEIKTGSALMEIINKNI